MPFRGFVEVSTGGLLSGWAVDEGGNSCELTVAVNGGAPVLIESKADRPDLVRLGISNGQGGFSFDPAGKLRDGPNMIELRFPDGNPVPGSPIFRTVGDAPPADEEAFNGFIESGDAEEVRGWAVTGAGLPCLVSASVNGTLALQAMTDRPRPDLGRRGMSAGLGGFSFSLAAFVGEGRNEIEVTFPDGSHVRGSPFTIGGEEAPPAQVAPSAGIEPEQEAASDGKGAAEGHGGASEAKMPSLPELDELSLDDLSLAVATGLVPVAPAAPPAEQGQASSEPKEVPAPAIGEERKKPGLLARLFGRSR